MKNKPSIINHRLWTLACGLTLALVRLTVDCGLWTVDCHAQTFAGGVPITGTTNAPFVNNGVIHTNSSTITFPAKTVTLSGIIATNQTIILSDAWQPVGGTNIIVLGSITNSLALANNGITGGVWQTDLPQRSYTLQGVPYVQAVVGNYTNTVYYP